MTAKQYDYGAEVEKRLRRNLLEDAMRPEGLSPGGGGGTYDGMEERVARLEEDWKEIKDDLKAIRVDMAGLKVDLAEVKGKISMMPTTLHLLGFAVAVFVAAGLMKWISP